mgnify:FL=1
MNQYPFPPMPLCSDIDRHTDEAYERGIQRQIDAEAERIAKYAAERKIVKEPQ